MSNKSVFARNLQYQMALNGKTRREICEALGFSYYTFSDWVNGKKYPRMDKVEMLANYFGVLKSDLIEEQIEKPTTENGSGLHGTKYDQLSPENKSVIDSLIEKLLKSQSGE